MDVHDFWGRLDVSSWAIADAEASGSHEVTWLIEPQDGTRWLHKNTTVHGDFNQGEDWAEVIATLVALALGVPAAPTKLCLRNERRGSLSRDIRAPEYDLIGGHIVLEDCADVTDYIPHLEGEPAQDPRRPEVKRPGHSIGNIQRALYGTLVPPGFEGPQDMDAFDVFTGYLLLDALVANRDRHEQNWSQLRPRLLGIHSRLAPSYDHSSSLGFAERPERLASRQNRTAVEVWCRKGTAGRFEHRGKPPTLVEVAVHALDEASGTARRHWRTQIDLLDLAPVLEPIVSGAIPERSEPTVSFVVELLNVNLERIRHELG